MTRIPDFFVNFRPIAGNRPCETKKFLDLTEAACANPRSPPDRGENCVQDGKPRCILRSMRIPKLEKPDRYRNLYVFDFGDHAGVGFTAEEVAELLESERYRQGKVYRIHRAYPDGRLEMTGVPAEKFQTEAGMLFYAKDEASARDAFKRLVNLAIRSAPPSRAKVHLAHYREDRYVVALIYPAEYDDAISSWLLAGDYHPATAVEGGAAAIEHYYRDSPEVLERHQLFGTGENISRTGDELLASLTKAVQR